MIGRISKIFLVLTIMIFSLNTVNVEAKVSRYQDNFSGYQDIASIVSSHIGELNRMIFSKGFSKDSDMPIYMLTLAKYSHNEWWFFSRDSLELKIDDEIKPLPVFKSESEYNRDNGYLPIYTGAHIVIPDEEVSKLKEAKTVIMRVHFNNKPSLDIEIPPNVLSEWKQVIATEK